MQTLQALATTLTAALALGNAKVLVAAIMTTNHRCRLKRLFAAFAQRFLEAHTQFKAHPHSRTALKRAQRAKAMVDLVRRRLDVTGARRPSDAELLSIAINRDLLRLVHSRKAA